MLDDRQIINNKEADINFQLANLIFIKVDIRSKSRKITYSNNRLKYSKKDNKQPHNYKT